VENIDGYRDQDMGDVIFGEPFCKASCVEVRRFDGLITIHNGNDNVTYQMTRSHPRFKHLSNAQCNKIKPSLKVSVHDKLNEISHPYQKLKSFYKGGLNSGLEYIRDAKMEEWLIRDMSTRRIHAHDTVRIHKIQVTLRGLIDFSYYIVYFAISQKVGNASKWLDEFKGSISSWVDLTEFFFGKYYPPSRTGRIMVIKNMSNDYEGVSNEEIFDVKEANNNDELETTKIFRIETNLFDYETPLCTEFKEFNFLLKVDPELFTRDIERTKTYEDYVNKLNDELKEPWSEDGVPYEICNHICEPFRFKIGKLNGPLAIQMKADSVTEESYWEWFGLVT
ncbi:hypothetical protein Tco_0786200, partial [Tanacetum coccineum]